jgi:hypothetical protein
VHTRRPDLTVTRTKHMCLDHTNTYKRMCVRALRA